MKTITIITSLLLSFAVFADARFVEAPEECHFPYDNANVDNEYKISACVGALKSRAGGGVVDAFITADQDGVPGGGYVIDGVDVRDAEAYPGGKATIRTSGGDSGTACNVVDANGNQFTTGNWTSIIHTYRTQISSRINVEYTLDCWGAQLVQ